MHAANETHGACAAVCLCPVQWPAQEGGYAVPPAPGFIQASAAPPRACIVVQRATLCNLTTCCGRPASPTQVGVSVEPLPELAAKEGSRLGDKMAFGRRVGLDLYRFLESFATQATGDAILIPASALDRWLRVSGCSAGAARAHCVN